VFSRFLYLHRLIHCFDRPSHSRGTYLRKEKTVESAQVAKNAELELLVKSQAQKIAELETAYADLKRDKENVTVG
jgi:uncharacterized protein involved in tolerance to divalent cations